MPQIANYDAFTANVQKIKTGAIAKLVGAFDHIDVSNDDIFSAVIREAINFGDIKPKMMANAFSVSEATIGRWAQGKNVPIQIARPVILEWIKTTLSQRQFNPT